ncbi:unnamed protein product [Symbiodinium sp. CCMP2456]|nr:unnamed protein product [Symbiodinium sp. CCMP2456]
MPFRAVLDQAQAFVNAELYLPGEEARRCAKKDIRRWFRDAAHSLEKHPDLHIMSCEKVLQCIASAVLQKVSQYGWFDSVDWSVVLAAFVADNTKLGSQEELLPVALEVVERWCRKRHKESRAAKQSVPPGQTSETCAAGKEILAKLQGKQTNKMSSERRTSRKDRGYKAAEVDLREIDTDFNYLWKAAEADLREIDTDLGYLAEDEPLGVSLRQGLLQIEATTSGTKSHEVLKPGDAIRSVNGVTLASQQDFWREVDRARPGQLRICVLPKSASRSLGQPPPPPPPKISEPLEIPAEGQDTAQIPVRDVRRSPNSAGSMIVLNCEDIGSSASKGGMFRPKGSSYPWDAVRCAIKFYEKLGFMTQPVCHQATLARHSPPAELRKKLVQCPVVDDDGRQEGRGSERIFVVTLAKTYECPFVDNSNYREQAWSGHDLWPWLQKEGLALKVEYIFDGFGEFLPSREVTPERTQAPTSTVSGRLRIPWSEYGGR